MSEKPELNFLSAKLTGMMSARSNNCLRSSFAALCCCLFVFVAVFSFIENVYASEQKTGLEKGNGFVYDPSGKRDPFRSLILGRKEAAEKKKKAEMEGFSRRKAAFERAAAAIPFTPLQAFDLGTLKLTMILLGSKGQYALVEAPGGRGYTVRKGTYLGRNQGIVKDINESGLVVLEKYFDEDEVIKTRRIEINLKKERL